jgi:hypothetical protein
MSTQHTQAEINTARFAGSWYSSDPARLQQGIEESLEAVETEFKPLRGAVVPHAGLAFSGRGLAEAFGQVEPDEVDTVIVLAPSHYARLHRDTLYAGAFDAHETPLGRIEGATDMPEGCEIAREAVEQEHAVELLLPYVRHSLLAEARLAAFLVPEMTSITAADRVAASLEAWMRAGERTPERTLVLVSSDFSHYGERFGYTPFGTHPVSEVEMRVARDDQALAASVADLDADAVWERLSRPISVCGRYPMLVATRLFARLRYRGKNTLYYNSNSFRASESDFVCYATVLFSERSS